VILVGDIGGTNARFALHEKGAAKPARTQSLSSRSFASLEACVKEFLGNDPPRIEAAVLGVAAPVVDQRARATNLPWTMDANEISRTTGIPRVILLNDLVALSLGALTLPADRLRVLSSAGAPRTKGENLAMIAAGTGLGESALIWDGVRHTPCATEGGHADFGARNALEFELFEFLQARYGTHVSYERAVSGPAFGALYEFFRDQKRMGESRENADRVTSAADRNQEIAALGAAKRSEAATRAVEMFASLYGAEAGNLALKTLATGGVFVAGAIAARYADVLAGPFIASFLDKGRFRGLLETVPVAVVLDSDIGLAGSAFFAMSGLY
jgi:glucokinase